MIKIEHVVLPSPEQMEFIIEGMRNPMNSWDKSDSGYCGGDKHIGCIHCSCAGDKEHNEEMIATDLKYGFGIKPCGKSDFDDGYCVGQNDLSLMQKLSAAGADHRKFMRMMPVMVRITAPLYWWKEFDTYKVGTVANSCSTMHKIQAKEFELSDFSTEHMKKPSIDILNETIESLNTWRAMYNVNSDRDKKDIWWQLIQLLPSSYNQTRNVMLNYEVLANIYHSRRTHKLDEWVEFCKWIETLPYSELITGGK